MSEDTVLDLFCGAGGFTLGCQQAGATVIAGVDNDEKAIETYDHNFDHPAYQYDLAETEPATFAVETGISTEDVDGIVGGPPCQGFSTANLQRDEDDPRNNLVFRYARYVDYYQPDWFVMENVTGIESIDDGETIELLYEDFEQAGYDVNHATLNAADYGVPQKRRRVFFVGVHEQTEGKPQFPEPTHAPKDQIDQTATTSSQAGVPADD
jgi:DNA (cytosine-5)-methyltransferase 1